jgi:hypothetical protein
MNCLSEEVNQLVVCEDIENESEDMDNSFVYEGKD